jgi:hypothetical protein
MPPPCSPSPRASHVPAAPPNQWPRRRTWPAPVHVVAAPTAHAATRTDFPLLGAQVSLSTALSSPIKGAELATARIAQTSSRHCRRQWCPQRAPPSGRLHCQRVLLLPALGSLVAPPFACCSGRATSLPQCFLQRPPPPASAVAARRHLFRRR